MGLKLASEKGPIERFEESLSNLSEGTHKLYLRNLHEYCKFVDETPDSLFELEKEAWASGDPANLLTIPNSVRSFMKHLIESGKATGTARTVAKAVTKFMKSNGFEFFHVGSQPKVDTKGQRIILKDQIRELHDRSGWSPRLRALFMVMKDTGLRVSDIAQLRCEDFWGAIVQENEKGEEFRIWADPKTTRKSGINAFVHMGPEAVDAVKLYLGGRKEGTIFLTERSMHHYELQENGSHLKTGESTQPGEPMSGTNITTIIRHACRHLKAKGYKVSAHSFRKFFLHFWTGAGFKDYGKLLAGKRLEATDEAYTWAWETGDLTKKYIELYDQLRIKTQSIDEVTRAKVETLEAELASMKAVAANAQVVADKRLEALNAANEARLQAAAYIDDFAETGEVSEELVKEVLRRIKVSSARAVKFTFKAKE